MNTTHFKIAVTMVAVVGVIALLGATPAYAGDLDHGKMIRHGRFVKHAPSANLDPTRGQTADRIVASGVTYDKGERGQYVRRGRVVKKMPSVAAGSSAGAKRDFQPARKRVVDHKKHKHYLP